MAVEDKYDRLARLMTMGKEKGYVLYDEVSELLPTELNGGADLDDVLTGLDVAGIEILEEPKLDAKIEEADEFLDLDLIPLGAEACLTNRPTVRLLPEQRPGPQVEAVQRGAVGRGQEYLALRNQRGTLLPLHLQIQRHLGLDHPRPPALEAPGGRRRGRRLFAVSVRPQ